MTFPDITEAEVKDVVEEERNKRSVLSKVVETGFLFLTWLALVRPIK
jgi:hypothetical protein